MARLPTADNGTYNPAYGNIQPTLFEVSPGRIVALLRTGVGVIAAAVSTWWKCLVLYFCTALCVGYVCVSVCACNGRFECCVLCVCLLMCVCVCVCVYVCHSPRSP